ncbi:MAG: sigma-70 family RNA polymerase sigma factor [Flavobacteriales bacterium]
MPNAPARTAPSATDRRKEFPDWVRAHTGDLLRYTLARVKGTEVAEDIVQVTFVSAWETLDRFAGDSSPRTWLFAILKHKLADHYRKSYREAKAVSGNALENDALEGGLFGVEGHWNAGHSPGQDANVFREDEPDERLDKALRLCLEALPGNLRTAVEMKYLLDHDSDAIQEALGITATNYWQQLHRAKLRLRECIKERVAGMR